MKAPKEYTITFKVTKDDYEAIKKMADLHGSLANPWAEKIVCSAARFGVKLGLGLSVVERIMFEEIARFRYLFGAFVELGVKQGLTEKKWTELLRKADRDVAVLADTMLAARARTLTTKKTEEVPDEDDE